jgi:hypothetical protein
LDLPPFGTLRSLRGIEARRPAATPESAAADNVILDRALRVVIQNPF